MIAIFFKAFISHDVGPVDLGQIKALFLENAIIVKTCGSAPQAQSLEKFIEPRQNILTDGTLLKFQEGALSIKIDIFGDIAQAFVLYQKSGVLQENPFEEMGMKTIQFVRTNEGWKISSLAWDDERAGLSVPPEYLPRNS